MKFLVRLAYSVVCPWGAWVAAGLSIANSLGIFGGDSKGFNLGAKVAANKADTYYDKLANLSQQEWDQWTTGGLPLLQSLATQAGTDRTAQEQDVAAGNVKDTYAASRKEAMRALNLEGASSDRQAAVLAPSYMDESARVSQALTATRRAEQERQFNQGLQVDNVYRGFAGQATSSLAAAAGGESALAGRYDALSQTRQANIAQGIYGTALLGRNAQKWFGSQTRTPTVTGQDMPTADYFNAQGTYGNFNPNSPDYSTGGVPNVDFGGGGAYRHGGAVRRRYAEGGGVIRGPGSGTSDSIAARSRPGSYILSADTVRAIGHKKVHEIIEKAGVRPGEGGDSYNGVPVRVSNGEAEIPPEAVRYHGHEFFDKLQQKYHRPVMSDDGQANGGVVRKSRLPKGVEDAIFRAMPRQAVGGAY